MSQYHIEVIFKNGSSQPIYDAHFLLYATDEWSGVEDGVRLIPPDTEFPFEIGTEGLVESMKLQVGTTVLAQQDAQVIASNLVTQIFFTDAENRRWIRQIDGKLESGFIESLEQPKSVSRWLPQLPRFLVHKRSKESM